MSNSRPLDADVYFNVYEDVADFYRKLAHEGSLGEEEEAVLSALNEQFGTSYEDIGDVSRQQFSEYHVEKHGKGEDRLGRGKYIKAYDNTPERKANKDDYFNAEQFDLLLNRLEASKGRQQRQRSVEGRRDIFAQGLAGMMGNF